MVCSKVPKHKQRQGIFTTAASEAAGVEAPVLGQMGGGQRRGGVAPSRGVRVLRNERRGIGVRRDGGTRDRGVEPGGQLPQTHHLLAPIHRAMIGSSFR